MKRLLILLIFIASNSFAAGIQKWTDDKGNVHYGDSPPIKTKTEPVRVTRPPSNPGKPLPKLSSDKSDNNSTSNEVTTKNKNRSTDDVNKQVCEKAKKNLVVITNSSLIRLKKSDGTEQVLSDEEIDKRRIKLEQDIKQYCQ